tara:strand:+ start:3589 stop:4491 length:903 start_codon:yes stop_codon:yes gene_type:complete
MDTIQYHYNHNSVDPETTRLGGLISGTRIGVEVEIENMPDAPRVPGWRCIPDGSLRNNGVEYVFNGPIGGSGATARLNRLQEGLDGWGTFGHRTSVHVHVDARDMLWSNVCDLVTLYAMVEPYLFSLCGQEREESIYSLSLYRGENQITDLLSIFTEGPMSLNSRVWSKYSAINLLSLRERGAIEFRGHSGTANKAVLVNWINHLLALKAFVHHPDKSLSCLPRMLSAEGPLAMLREVFGNLVDNNRDHVLSSETKLYQGAWVAEELLFHTRMREVQASIMQNNVGQKQLSKLKDKLCAD